MEDKENIFESLLESVEDYSKTSIELLKLKVLDKTSDYASSLIPWLAAVFALFIFLLMLSIGVAFWLGEILGKNQYGFFLVAAFYGLTGIILYFFMHKWIKRRASDFIIRKALK
jgi:hypothetical protein